MNVSCDQMSAAAGFVSREFGEYGYRFTGIESPAYRVSVFRVECVTDGSRFSVVADCWGNVRHVDTHANDDGLAAVVTEMHKNAMTP